MLGEREELFPYNFQIRKEEITKQWRVQPSAQINYKSLIINQLQNFPR